MHLARHPAALGRRRRLRLGGLGGGESQVLASQLAQHPKDDEPRQRIEDQKRGRGTGEGAEGADDDQ